MITGSALERVYNCPSSEKMHRAASTTEASLQGTSNHSAIEVGLLTGNLSGLPDVVKGFAGNDVTIRVEVAYALDVEQRTVRCIGERIGRNYGNLGEWEIALTVDAVFSGETTKMVDWKSRERVTPAASNWQIRAGCLAVMTELGLQDIDGAIAYLDDGHIDSMSLDVFGAEALWVELEQLVRTAKSATVGEVHSGPWCKYCPAFVHCPAQTKLALAMIGEAVGVDMAVATMTDEQAGRAWEKVKEFQLIAARVEDALRTRAKRSPLPLANGKRLALVEQTRKSVDTKRAQELLETAGIAVPYKTSTFATVKEIRGLTLVAKNEEGDAA